MNTQSRFRLYCTRMSFYTKPVGIQCFCLFIISSLHYNDVIMSTMASQNHLPHDCLLNRLYRLISKKASKLRVTGLRARNSPVTGDFLAQRASNAENVSIWWRHHDLLFKTLSGSGVIGHGRTEPWLGKWLMCIMWHNMRDWRLTIPWWRYQIETFSALLVLCSGISPVTGEFPSQRLVTRSSGVFFDLRLNKNLCKQSRRRWFESPPRSLSRHCNTKSCSP